MLIVVFEDDHVERLYPITIGRPAYAISCGGCRLVDLLAELGAADQRGPIQRGLVRDHLAEIQRLDYPQLAAGKQKEGPVLLVNARLAPSRASAAVLKRLIDDGRPGAIRCGDQLAAALLSASAAAPASDVGVSEVSEYLNYVGAESLPPLEGELVLLEYPHDVIRVHLQILSDNLEHRLANGTYREIADGVFAAEGATLGEHVVSDTRRGPIVLEANSSIGPYCYLSGPALLERGARVIEHAAIKDAVALGHTTKIGGEVEASIVEPFTNKQHHGFLGHSYLGSWINLGAGTCNSDLKNTYGAVKMEYRGEKIATGMQFVGCIMGDYAKSAINTGIFTGKTIGVCSMVYGFVTTNVPSFVNYARLFGQVTELPPEVMIATQERMFLRRNVEQRSCDVQLIYDMYELTRDERQLAGEPLSL